MVESVRRPRKSILSRPTRSHVGPSHCVTMSSLPLVLQSGTMFSSGCVAIDDAGRVHAGVAGVILQRSGGVDDLLHHGIRFVLRLEVRLLLERRVERDVQLFGTRFASRCPSAGGSPITRATSLIAALAFRRPNVMICATWPYFWRT